MGEDPKSIGQRLVLARKALGMDSGEFAKKAGVLPSAISMYESGERPCSLANAIKFVHRYGLTLDWIYLGDHTALPAKLDSSMRTIIDAREELDNR